MQPLLTVSIPTRNRAPYLARCLEHLLAAREWPFEFEVVVSDNASTDWTADVVANAVTQGLPVRYLRQREDVGAEHNVASALRAARGELCLYLGDDDRLDLARVAEIAALFKRTPELVCAQAPWISRDDTTGADLGLYYAVERATGFGAGQALGLWSFLLERGIFPEIAIYRTRALRPVLFVPHTLHWAFLWCFRLLAQGTVAFLPTPFYIHVVRPAADLPPRTQLGVDQAGTHLDRYRGGLEWALCAALDGAGAPFSTAERAAALERLAQFQGERAAVAARIARGRHDFVGALEHEGRAAFATEDRAPTARRQAEQELITLAAYQSVAQVARTTAGVARLVLVGMPDGSAAAALIRKLGFDGSIEVRNTAQDARELCACEDTLALVPNDHAASSLGAVGVPADRILEWRHVFDNLRLINPIGAAVATRRARAVAAATSAQDARVA